VPAALTAAVALFVLRAGAADVAVAAVALALLLGTKTAAVFVLPSRSPSEPFDSQRVLGRSNCSLVRAELRRVRRSARRASGPAALTNELLAGRASVTR